MVYFENSQEWLIQSSQLLQARPSTAKITSKYTVFGPNSSKVQKRKPKQKSESSPPPTNLSDAASNSVASFTIKTYDPESGACLKYRTNKAAEVGRLITCLGKLARCQAALPEAAEPDAMVLDVPEGGTGANTPLPEASKEERPGTPQTKPNQRGGGGGGGGGKKKKKGKK